MKGCGMTTESIVWHDALSFNAELSGPQRPARKDEE